MKTKFYFLTLAASVAFAACTNEDFDSINNAEIQKAELVALDDVQASVSAGEGSRIANGAWETTDEIGVGFTNWASNTGSTTYTGTKRVGGKWANANDGALFANHRLFRTEGSWKFENVVYEGLHYAYYPLDAEHVEVKPLTATVSTKQVAGSEAAFEENGLFAISPMYDLVKTEAGKAPVVAFDLKTISNRLKLNLEVANFASITDPIIIKSVKVVEASATPVASFAQSAVVGNVPTAIYTNLLAWENLANGHENKTAAKKAEAIAADKKLTDDAFKAGVISALNYGAGSTEMGTTVAGHEGFTTAAPTYAVNVFSFPVKSATAPANLKVVVETNYGTVTIAPVATASLSSNAATKAIQVYNNEKLATLLTVLNGTHETVKFTEFGKAASVSLKLNMATKVLNEFNVTTAAEWADAVRIAGQSTGNLTINVNDNIAADITNLPATVKTINVKSGKYFDIEGTFPQDVTIAGTGVVRVLSGKSLTVNGTIPAPITVTLDATAVNNGQIEIGENGALVAANVTNHGTVINKKSLKVTTFVNHFDAETTVDSHTCHGVVKNYATLDIATTFTNKGSFYSIGASANIKTGQVDNTNGQAFTEDGGSFEGVNGGALKATVNTPAQMDAAVKAKATQITITGVVSMTEELQVATKVILASNAELYILGTNVAGTTAATSKMKIDVTGVNTKISTKTPQYINELNVKAGNDLTILPNTKLDVHKCAYEVNSTVTNNGYGVIVANFTNNKGTWNGLSANMYVMADGTLAVLPGF